MSSIVIPSAQNRLLDSLPPWDRSRLLVDCEPVRLGFAETLGQSGQPLRHAYFPIGGVIALVMPVGGDAGLQVGLVGHEGMCGATLALGIEAAPFHALVLGEGPALRIAAAALHEALDRSPALRLGLQRYLYVSMAELAQAAVCTRFHVLEARLAHWLLMLQDRADSDTLHVTQAFIASMLGVRRVGITKAANTLQRRRLIGYRRGDIAILDRPGLEAAACACYRIGRETYRRILGPGLEAPAMCGIVPTYADS